MPLPPWLARLNRVGTNRLLGPLAHRAPGFGMLVHHGRRSGRTYRTPLCVFRHGDGFLVALTYGPGTDWVKNVIAAGGCELFTRGRRVRLTNPRLWHDPGRTGMPPVPRTLTGLIGVTEFLLLDPDGRAREQASERNGGTDA